jgi:hypothetical protein
MIYGTTPPEQLWPDAPADHVALWHRERNMIDALRDTPRSRRRAAVEVTCACPKHHLVMTALVLPGDSVALWVHGGRIAEGDVVTPESEVDSYAGQPERFVMPDSLEIRLLADLKRGHWASGLLNPRCDRPHKLLTHEVEAVATAIDEWKKGKRNTPMRASLAR